MDRSSARAPLKTGAPASTLLVRDSIKCHSINLAPATRSPHAPSLLDWGALALGPLFECYVAGAH